MTFEGVGLCDPEAVVSSTVRPDANPLPDTVTVCATEDATTVEGLIPLTVGAADLPPPELLELEQPHRPRRVVSRQEISNWRERVPCDTGIPPSSIHEERMLRDDELISGTRL